MEKTLKLPLKDIKVEDRQRQDLGDIQSLANSIQEFGLIQPIVINQDNRLIAGGRRLAACTLLGLSEVPVVYLETLSEAQLTILELEENIRRKDLTWKEECLGILKVHKFHVHDATARGEQWMYSRTGELLGQSTARVGYSLLIARELNNPDSSIHQCTGVTDALKWLMERRQREGQAILAKSLQVKSPLPEQLGITPTPIEFSEEKVENKEVEIPLSRMLLQGNSLEVLAKYPPNSFDHCITDPPYGIDMEMLDQGPDRRPNVEAIKAEHQVNSNLDLLEKLFPLVSRVLRPKGFFALWCDIDNWHLLKQWAEASDFRVQRWPLIWHKTSPCQNMAAQYNFTKNYEACMVCRKPSAVLAKTTPSSIITHAAFKADSNMFAKPLEVWQYLIEALTLQNQVILDPFCGEGSSLEAFLTYHRSFVGIEINPQHFNVALIRVKEWMDVMYRKPKYS